MLIGVIYSAPNCPIHDQWAYLGLKWFHDVDELLDWLACQTRMNFYIKDVWNAEKCCPSDVKIQYQRCQHHYIGVEVFNEQSKIAYIRQHSHGSDKKWVIEKENCNNVL